MWKCVCGYESEDIANFCIKCGTKKPSTQTRSEVGSWFYTNNGIRTGPVSIQQLKVLIQKGTITRSTLVWRKGFSDWRAANTTDLKVLFDNIVPPVAKSSISDKWTWCLATIPHVANLFLFELLRPVDGSIADYFILFTVWGLHCLFLSLDVVYLKKAGIDIQKHLYLGIILVPVYLFVRAGKTNKHFWPAIIWCIIEILLLLPIW